MHPFELQAAAGKFCQRLSKKLHALDRRNVAAAYQPKSFAAGAGTRPTVGSAEVGCLYFFRPLGVTLSQKFAAVFRAGENPVEVLKKIGAQRQIIQRVVFGIKVIVVRTADCFAPGRAAGAIEEQCCKSGVIEPVTVKSNGIGVRKICFCKNLRGFFLNGKPFCQYIGKIETAKRRMADGLLFQTAFEFRRADKEVFYRSRQKRFFHSRCKDRVYFYVFRHGARLNGPFRHGSGDQKYLFKFLCRSGQFVCNKFLTRCERECFCQEYEAVFHPFSLHFYGNSSIAYHAPDFNNRIAMEMQHIALDKTVGRAYDSSKYLRNR